jgi:glycosyltransferase involved in cell wall biosynthesis
MDADPRVALVASSFWPHVGGVEEHVRQVAREFADRGVNVEVWTVDRGDRLGSRLVDGVRVRYLPTPLPARSVAALFTFVWKAPAAWREWRRADREFLPDLLHVQCFGPNGIYALAMHRRTRVPIAVTSHGETLADDRGIFARSALLRRALREALKRSIFVTAPSQVTLADLRDAYGLSEGLVVPNGVDVSVDTQESDRSNDEEPYFASVGRLGWMKGFDLVIEAFSRADLPNGCRLLIGGDGPEREALNILISQKGLDGRVILLGALTPHDVSRVMANSLAVVVPSRMESFGIVALEAWRAGAALIMTDRGGAPEFVRDDEDGLLIDPTDTEALVRALRRVATDAGLRHRLAQAGRERVPEFTWEAVASAYLRLYASVTPRRQRVRVRGGRE